MIHAVPFFVFFQSITDQLSVSFKYTDKESGVDDIKVQIYEVAGGTRTQKYPGQKLDKQLFTNSHLTLGGSQQNGNLKLGPAQI